MNVGTKIKKMKRLELSNGGVAFVSDRDFSRVRWFTWWQSGNYAMRALPRNGCGQKGKKFNQLLHVLILGNKKGFEIDHRNRNGLDCRRRNLRWATHSQNIANGPKRRGSSRFKGVSWMNSKGRWRATIKHNYIQTHLGLFTSEVMAARAYDAAARHLFREYAKTNF